MAPPRIIAFVCLVVAGVQSINAQFQPISSYLQLENVNGFAVQNQTVTGYCISPGTYNFNVTASDGTNLDVQIVCPLVQDIYTFGIKAWIPMAAVLTQSQACLSQNILSYNLSLASQAGMQTLGFRSGLTNDTSPRNQTLGSSVCGAVASIAQSVGCSAANSVTYGLAGDFGGPCAPSQYGPSWDDFQSYTDLNARQWGNQDKVNKGFQNWTVFAEQRLDLLDAGLVATRQYQTDNTNAVTNLTQVAINQQAQINEIANQTAAGINFVNSEVTATYALMQQGFAALSGFENATVSAFNQTLIQIASLTLQVNGLLYNSSFQMYLFNQDTTQKFQTVSQSLLG